MSTIIVKAKEIVAQNGMSDKITLLQGKMEEVGFRKRGGGEGREKKGEGREDERGEKGIVE